VEETLNTEIIDNEEYLSIPRLLPRSWWMIGEQRYSSDFLTSRII
jgi:hypothetical protein